MCVGGGVVLNNFESLPEVGVGHQFSVSQFQYMSPNLITNKLSLGITYLIPQHSFITFMLLYVASRLSPVAVMWLPFIHLMGPDRV